MQAIADTGWLVAFWNARDVHHAWARGLDITAPPLVCEAVLSEAAWHTRSPACYAARWRSANRLLN